MDHLVPGTVRLALHCNCDFYKEKGCWRYNQKFCVQTEMSTDTTLSDLHLRLRDTIAPVAGHKGKVTSVSSRLPGKKFNGNPAHLKAIESEEDLQYLLNVCKNSLVVNKDIYRVDVFVTFEPLNIEEEFGKDVVQFLAKLKDDQAFQDEVLAGLEELNQEEWEDDIFLMDEDVVVEESSEELKEPSIVAGQSVGEGDTGAISLDKIGAYRPASAADACNTEEAEAGQVEENEVVDVHTKNQDDEGNAVPRAVTDKASIVPELALEGEVEAEGEEKNMATKKSLKRSLKKIVRPRRALSKFFGLFSCVGAPSCMA